MRACVRNPNRRMARRLARAQARLCSQALRKEVETAFEALELALHSAASLAPGLPSMVRCMLHAAGSMSHVVCCMLHVPCCMLHVPCCMLPVPCLHVAPGLPGLGMHGASELACRTRLRALHRDAHCGLHRLWSATAVCQKANATGRAQRSSAGLALLRRLSYATCHAAWHVPHVVCPRAGADAVRLHARRASHRRAATRESHALQAPRDRGWWRRAETAAVRTHTGLAPRHICAGTGLAPATSAPGVGSPLPHLHRDWARPLIHLHWDWARPLPHLHRDWVHPLPPLQRAPRHPCASGS